MNRDLERARKALAAGRPDEAKVHLWNALATATDAELPEVLVLARSVEDEQLVAELERRGVHEPPAAAPRRSKRRNLVLFGLRVFLPVLLVLMFLMQPQVRRPSVDDTVASAAVAATPLDTSVDVYLAPLGRFSPAAAERLAMELRQRGMRALTVSPVEIPRYALNTERKQLEADALITKLWRRCPIQIGNTAVIGLTDLDMYSRRRPDWRYAFAQRGDWGYAVVSNARMGPPRIFALLGPGRRDERLRKMVMRYVYRVAFHEELVDDPTSLLRREIGGPADIDEMEDAHR